jgi:hypothetical protein
MTTRPDQYEPLDAEERDLAARLGRVGPNDGPSPALDARILAAAHAAAATHKPRRHGRLAWLGLPPALVTGVGVAAAAVLALGLVWQLRPQYGAIATQQEAGADEEVIIMAEPLGAGRAPAANPPPLLGQTDTPPPAARAQVDKSTAAADAAAPASANVASAPPTPEPVDERGVSAAQAASAEAKREADAAGSAARADDGFTPDPPEAAAAQAPVRKSHATYTTAARATAERRERARIAAAAPPAAPAPVAASPPASAAAEAEDTTLDRVEVTGSRIRRSDVDWSQVPVSEDTHLAAAEWLERIRDRRDADDLDNARASLRLFRRDHPRTRVPNDLRALLAADAPR